jgi:tetratricopeptide (TPR) repeat protein
MHSSKLSILCDKVIEAGWLAIVIITPTMFTIRTLLVFDLNKMALLRSIATIMAAFWAIQWFEQRKIPHSEPEKILRIPLSLPILILCGVNILSTLTSIVPGISFLGSYQRSEGLYSFLSYILIFFAIVAKLTSRKQLDRLIMAVILSSMPVALYGIIQHSGNDPFIWIDDITKRVGANIGNPIFLASYLILVFFLTLGRIVKSGLACVDEKESKGKNIIRVLTYGSFALFQLITVILSLSRGPWMGWLIGMFFFVIIAGMILRMRKLVLSSTCVGLTALLFLAVFNMPHSPLGELRLQPYIGQLGKLAESKTGSGEVRVTYWKAVSKLVSRHKPLEFPDGSKDVLNVLRPLIGYGSEALTYVGVRFLDPENGTVDLRNYKFDHSHNETWDTLAYTGLLGFLAYQFLLISFFVYGFKLIGLIISGREQNTFIGLWIGLGLCGGLAAIILGRPWYFGLGLPFGILVGIFIYLIVHFLTSFNHKPEITEGQGDRILLAALIAAFLAHFMEMQFGIASASSSSLFWVFGAIMVAVGNGRISNKEQSATDNISSGESGLSTLESYAFMMALLLSTLFYAFVNNPARLFEPADVLWQSLTTINLGQKSSFGVASMVLLTWLLGTIVAFTGTVPSGLPEKRKNRPQVFLLFALVSLGLAFGYGLSVAGQLASLIQLPINSYGSFVTFTDKLANIFVIYFIWVLALIGILAVAFVYGSRPMPKKNLALGWKSIFLFLIICVAAFFWINYANMDRVQADNIGKQGESWEQQSQQVAATIAYKHAVEKAPFEEFFYVQLGKALLAQAGNANDSPMSTFRENPRASDVLNLDPQRISRLNRNDLLLAAEAILKKVMAQNPLNAEHYSNLGSLYMKWITMTGDSAQKNKLFNSAARCFTQAINLSPNDVDLINTLALTEVARQDMDSAQRLLDKSFKINKKFDETFYIQAEKYRISKDLDRAVLMYQKAIDLSPKNIKVLNTLAFVYGQKGKISEAIETYQKLLAIPPDTLTRCNAHKNLAVLLAQKGDLDSAIKEAEAAVVFAPEYAKQAFQGYVNQLKGQSAKH